VASILFRWFVLHPGRLNKMPVVVAKHQAESCIPLFCGGAAFGLFSKVV